MMSHHIRVSARSFSRVALAAVFGMIANTASAQSIQGPTGATGSRNLEATYWKAIELAGKPIPAQDAKREAHLVFQAGKLSGSNGCNRITGMYQLKGDAVTFGQTAATF